MFCDVHKVLIKVWEVNFI